MNPNLICSSQKKTGKQPETAFKSCSLRGSVESFLADVEKGEISKQYAREHQSSKRGNMSGGRRTEEGFLMDQCSSPEEREALGHRSKEAVFPSTECLHSSKRCSIFGPACFFCSPCAALTFFEHSRREALSKVANELELPSSRAKLSDFCCAFKLGGLVTEMPVIQTAESQIGAHVHQQKST